MQDSTIKLVTYNIHRAIGVDRRFRLDRVLAILEHHGADVVFLQEVDVGVPRSGSLNLATEISKNLDYPHVAVGLNVPLREGAYGNATLSRFPIVAQENVNLTVGRRKPRGALYTRLRVGEGESCDLQAFNLHLGLSAQERTVQIGMLSRHALFRAVTPAEACLVVGDFNDWRGRLTPIFTEILGFRCATAPGAPFRRGLLTYPSFSPAGALDKVFVNGPIEALSARRCRLQVAKIASDHLPVIVELSRAHAQPSA